MRCACAQGAVFICDVVDWRYTFGVVWAQGEHESALQGHIGDVEKHDLHRGPIAILEREHPRLARHAQTVRFVGGQYHRQIVLESLLYISLVARGHNSEVASFYFHPPIKGWATRHRGQQPPPVYGAFYRVVRSRQAEGGPVARRLVHHEVEDAARREDRRPGVGLLPHPGWEEPAVEEGHCEPVEIALGKHPRSHGEKLRRGRDGAGHAEAGGCS